MSAAASAPKAASRGAFLTVWAGQVVSTIGSGLSGFALGLWVLQQTGRVTPFAAITFLAVLPGLVLAPLTGTLIDRHDRRIVMLLADAGAAVCTLALWFLFAQGTVRLGWIGLLVTLSASCNAIQSPAYAAATTQMVRRETLGRANGLVQLGQSVSEILTPALAGVLMLTIGVPGILLLDLASFLFAVGTLALVRWPALPRAAEDSPKGEAQSNALRRGWATLRRDAAEGWRYLLSRPGLVALLAFLAMVNFCWGMVRVLIAPLILGFGSSATLGTLISVAGAGLLTGSLWLSAWGGPRRKVDGVLRFELLSGVAFIIIGARPAWALVAVGVFLAHLTVAMVQGCNQTLWQTAVPTALQGRVFSLRNAVSRITVPVAVLLAGPLADRFFEPWMRPDGALADSLGRWIGAGPGRGAAAIFLLMGALKIAASLWGLSWPNLKHVED